jgi:hypothetical protein
LVVEIGHSPMQHPFGLNWRQMAAVPEVVRPTRGVVGSGGLTLPRCTGAHCGLQTAYLWVASAVLPVPADWVEAFDLSKCVAKGTCRAITLHLLGLAHRAKAPQSIRSLRGAGLEEERLAIIGDGLVSFPLLFEEEATEVVTPETPSVSRGRPRYSPRWRGRTRSDRGTLPLAI